MGQGPSHSASLVLVSLCLSLVFSHCRWGKVRSQQGLEGQVFLAQSRPSRMRAQSEQWGRGTGNIGDLSEASCWAVSVGAQSVQWLKRPCKDTCSWVREGRIIFWASVCAVSSAWHVFFSFPPDEGILQGPANVTPTQVKFFSPLCICWKLRSAVITIVA